MSVSLEKETAKELISFKLHHIQEEIQKILKKWNEDNTDDFISKAKKGILENAEMDAISIRQLVADYKRLKKLLESINSD
jgi:6-phosphogluconate dehydrogenase